MSERYKMNNLSSVDALLFEVLERIAIFYLHLQETDIRFFSPRSFPSSESHLVASFTDCLSKMLHCAVAVSSTSQIMDKDSGQSAEAFQQIMDIISTINEFHKTHLGHLPRPPEPPELKRFGRILQKHALQLEKKSGSVEKTGHEANLEGNIKISSHSDICIYLGEEVTETVFAGDPLAEYKLDRLNKIIEKTNVIINKDVLGSVESFAQQEHENLGYHLTVPRIDATNPCRWPTLVHELGHRIMSEDFFKYSNIEKDFIDALSQKKIELTTDIIKSIDLRSWLT
jgi:hypothetical protein